MIKVGITGGIGSGKTTVCKVFSVLGIPIFYSDPEARKLMNLDKNLKKQLKKILGDDIYTENGLDREKMAGIIFKNKDTLKKINSVVHPAVRNHFHSWCESQKDKPYIMQEAAILFESGAYKNHDKTITVYAPENERIARVMKRDGASQEKVKNRIKNQLSDEEKIKLSDFVINNRESDLIIPQVLHIHSQLINLV